MSRLIFVIGFLSVSFIAQVAAHGRLTAPLSSDSVRPTYQQNAPVALPLASDFVCRNDKPLPSSQWTTLTAGQSSQMTWSFDAPHPGDCFAYISYDADVEDTKKKWFKVGQWRDCDGMNNVAQSFQVPAGLPSCEHCILRWEWYALHLQQVGSVEFYSQCADVKIAGKSSGSLPTPQVTIPGHLPMAAKAYRDPYGSDAYTGPMVGPPLATYGGADYSCSASYGSSCGVSSSTPSVPASPPSTPTIPPVVYPSTTGIKVVKPSTTGAASRPVTPSTTGSVPVVVIPDPVPAPVTPSSTGKKPTPIRSTTGMTQSVPSSSSTSTSSSASSGSCHLGDQICEGTSSYRTCTNGRTENYWAEPQKCRSGLSCHPSSTSNNIYCY